MKQLEDMYHNNKQSIVAIGEIWLDYHWLDALSKQHNLMSDEIIQTQKEFFIAQINLSCKLWLPIVIHNRNSSEDVLKILEETGCKNFVFHCFSEDYAFAQKLLKLAPNCKLGFGWVVTFKNASTVQNAAKNIPLKNILIETDSPYLTPSPYRGKQENEPLYCEHVLSKIIDLRDESPEEIRKTLYDNSIEFFLWK